MVRLKILLNDGWINLSRNESVFRWINQKIIKLNVKTRSYLNVKTRSYLIRFQEYLIINICKRESINVLDFFIEDSNWGDKTVETNVFDWTWSGIRWNLAEEF